MCSYHLCGRSFWRTCITNICTFTEGAHSVSERSTMAQVRRYQNYPTHKIQHGFVYMSSKRLVHFGWIVGETAFSMFYVYWLEYVGKRNGMVFSLDSCSFYYTANRTTDARNCWIENTWIGDTFLQQRTSTRGTIPSNRLLLNSVPWIHFRSVFFIGFHRNWRDFYFGKDFFFQPIKIDSYCKLQIIAFFSVNLANKSKQITVKKLFLPIYSKTFSMKQTNFVNLTNYRNQAVLSNSIYSPHLLVRIINTEKNVRYYVIYLGKFAEIQYFHLIVGYIHIRTGIFAL